MTYELTLRSLRVLVAVSETGSVGQAAEQLHLTQPALSQHIARVSDIFGAPVTERHGRGIRLTEVGRIVVAHARDVERCLSSARSAVDDLNGLTHGHVRIGVLQSVNFNLIPRALGRLASLHPGIRVAVRELSGGQIEQQVVSGELDLGIGLSQIAYEDVEATHLYTENILFVKQHHDDDTKVTAPISLAEACEQPLALLSDEFTTRRLINFHCLGLHLVPHPTIETNAISALLELVRVGGFRTLLPYSALMGLQGNSAFCERTTEPRIRRTVSILRRRSCVASLAAVAFVTTLQTIVSELAKERDSEGGSRVWIEATDASST